MTLKEQKIKELFDKVFDLCAPMGKEILVLPEEITESLSEMFDYAIDLAAENAKLVYDFNEDLSEHQLDSAYVDEHPDGGYVYTLIPSKQSILQLKTKEI